MFFIFCSVKYFILELTQVGYKLFEEEDYSSTSAVLCFYSEHQRESHNIVYAVQISWVYVKSVIYYYQLLFFLQYLIIMKVESCIYSGNSGTMLSS